MCTQKLSVVMGDKRKNLRYLHGSKPNHSRGSSMIDHNPEAVQELAIKISDSLNEK